MVRRGYQLTTKWKKYQLCIREQGQEECLWLTLNYIPLACFYYYKGTKSNDAGGGDGRSYHQKPRKNLKMLKAVRSRPILSKHRPKSKSREFSFCKYRSQNTTQESVLFPPLHRSWNQSQVTKLMCQLPFPMRPDHLANPQRIFYSSISEQSTRTTVFFCHQLLLTEDITQHRKKSPNCHLSVLHIPLFNMVFCSIYIDENLKQTKGTLVKLPFLLQLYWNSLKLHFLFSKTSVAFSIRLLKTDYSK